MILSTSISSDANPIPDANGIRAHLQIRADMAVWILVSQIHQDYSRPSFRHNVTQRIICKRAQ
jgi:hypothetical protein